MHENMKHKNNIGPIGIQLYDVFFIITQMSPGGQSVVSAT